MKKVFKTMAFTLLGLVLSINLMAENAKVDDILWKESFYGGSSSTAFSETSSWTTGNGTTMLVAADKNKISYSASNGMLSTASSGGIDGSHCWLKKSTTGYFQVNNIPIYNAKKLVASLIKNGKTVITFSYKFDTETSWNNSGTTGQASNTSGSSSEITVPTNAQTISLKFTRNDNNDASRIDDLTLTVTDIATAEGETSVAISPEGGEFVDSKEITLTPTPADAAVYYTTNGDEPTASSTPYEAPFTISSSCTIKAIAIKEGCTKQNVASAEFTKATPLSTMDAIFNASATAGDYYITFDNWVISGVKGSNAYLTDNAGNGLIIYISNHGFVAGDVLSGTVKCALKKYNGSAEITDLTSSSTGLTVTKGGSVTAVEKSIKDLSGVNTGALISLGTLTYNGSDVFSDGTNTIKAYNSIMTTLPSWTSGLKYTVQGIYIQFNTTQEIAPRDENDIVEKSADKFNITIADDIQNGSVSVQGGKTQAAEGEQVVLTIAPEEGYKLATLIVDGSDVAASVVDNKYTFSMPAKAVTVSATFAAKDVYTITWKVKGQADATTEVVEGETLSLPTAPTFEGYKFVGWTANAIEGKQSTPPTLLANNTTPTESKTYYAVFAVVTGTEPLEGSYTLDYAAEGLADKSGWGTYSETYYTHTASDGSQWEINAYKSSGMQLNKGKTGICHIKVPSCPGYITAINITANASAKSATKFSATLDESATALATATEGTSQTLDLTGKNVTDGYILATGNVQITKVVVNYSGSQDVLGNYTTNPTSQVRIHFDLGDGTGTFNDEFVDEGSDYTVTTDKPTPAIGYEFVDWINGDNHYVGGNTIENVTSDITLTAQYQKSWYAVGKAAMENGDITITPLTEGKAEYGATVTLTPAPATNYALESIEAYKTGDDATKVTLTLAGDNYTFTMPAYAVEISATFLSAASSCDINFYAAGNTTTPMKTISKKRGEKYEITEVGTAVDGFTFVGWATATQDAEVETPITTVSSVTPEIGGEEDINLYAVYKRAAVEAAYEKVTAEPTSWEGQYLFVYEDNTTPVALDGSLETIDVAKDTIHVTITDGKILSTAKTNASAMTIEKVTSGYSVKSAAGYYIYASSYKNDMSSQKNYQDKCKVQISLENGITQTFTDGTVTIKYNKTANDSRFRFYKSGQQVISYFKLGEASYVYTTSPVVKYIISYDLNGGSKGDGNFDEQPVVKGNDATITESIPTKTGYTFVNWKDADENTYNPGATISNVQKDIKLVAQYNVNKYVVTHTATYGAINVATLDAESKAEYGATLTISLEPESGYEIDPTVELKAYKTGDESTPVSITDNTITMPDYAITIVAGFRAETPKYTINVQSNNTEQGTVSIFEETETTLSLKEGDERTILAWPNEGYRFVNWTTEDDITITGADEDEATFTVKTSDATITANFEAIPSVIYTKITTTDDLAYNDKVIIVAATADKAMSATQNTNNRSEVAITRGDAGATITLATDEVAVLDVLSGNKTQTFAFHDANGYLYAASSSSNNMKSKAALDDNGSWVVAISEGSATIVAQGSYTRNLMQYNPNNGNGIFTCYASHNDNYQYVSLYRIKSDDQVLVTLMNGEEVFARYRADKNSSITLNGFTPTIADKVILGWTDGETVYAADDEVAVAETNITLNIKVCDFVLEDKAAGAYATICLPGKIDHVENATLFRISHGDINKVEFEEVTDFSAEVAGMPYLVQATADGNVNFYYAEAGDAVTDPVDAETANGFVGSLQEEKQEVPDNGMSLLVSGGQLHLALDGCYLTQYHAYIDVNKVPASPNKAPNMAARRVTLYNAEAQVPTNLNGLNGNMKATKVLRDGQLYIIRDTKTYNAQGIEVQ